MSTASVVDETGFQADPGVPARDLLLDPDAVADRLAAGLGRAGRLPVIRCEPVRVKYRLGESLRVLYRIHLTGDRSWLVAGRTLPDADATRAMAHRHATDPQATDTVGDLRAVWHDRSVGTVWWTFPHDRRLRGLHSLLRPTEPVAHLAARAGRWSTSEVVGFTPENSAVLRACDDGGATIAFAKLYAPGTVSVSSLAALYDGVAASLQKESASLRAPTCLGFSADRDLLLLEAVPGRSWVVQEPAAVLGSMHQMGSCIAVLHGSTVPPGANLTRFARLDPRHVAHAAELVGAARPDVAAATRRLAAHLAATVPSPDRTMLLHGDCHPGNLLVHPGGVTLIDVDQAGLGPAGLDIASLLARLRQGQLTGEFGAASTRAMGQAFRAGYATVRSLPDRSSLVWHVAAALLVERALRAVNRVHRPVLARLPELIEGAQRVLCEGDL